ncbi:MAG TPA: hypothetical protein VK903_03180 [Propionicimonas sp.]|nr:hypothetical protein [Propionicimonas sp.]
MARYARLAREPAGVLVVTVWADADGLHRVVSLTDPEPRAVEPAPELRRNHAADDAAVLDLVRTWLEAVGERSRRPVPRAVK